MAITTHRTSGFSLASSVSTSSGDDEDIYQTTSAVEVSTGPVEADPGTSAMALATVDAIAAGTSTLTSGSVGILVDSSGAISSGSATAEVHAIAASEGDGTTYAAANASASLSGLSGAGFSLSRDSTTYSQDEEGSIWTATSQETVRVVETTPDGTHYEIYDEPGSEYAVSFDETSYWDEDWEWDDEEFDAGLDGNTAIFWADAEAYGEDTYVAVDISALVFEDELSLLNISALAISA